MNLQDIDIIHAETAQAASIERNICARDNPSGKSPTRGTLWWQRPRLHDGRNPAVRDNDLFAAAIGIAIGGIKEIYAPSSARLMMGRLLSSGSVHADYRDLARQRSYSRGKVGKHEVGFS